MFQFLKNYSLTTFRKVSCFACYGALSCGLASIKQLRLRSGTCSEVARTSTCCWSEVLSGQLTPETLNRSTLLIFPEHQEGRLRGHRSLCLGTLTWLYTLVTLKFAKTGKPEYLLSLGEKTKGEEKFLHLTGK